MICGHPTAAIVSSDEGTAYCRWCALEAENARLREQLEMMREKADCGHPMVFQVRTQVGFDETHCIECERDAARGALIEIAKIENGISLNGCECEACEKRFYIVRRIISDAELRGALVHRGE